MSAFTYCPRCATALTEQTHGDRPRAACPADGCGFVHWDNPVPVVAAIVEHPEGVLLVRNKGWPEKWFGLVTGFLEKGESPEEGVLREVEEELGLRAELGDFVGLYPFHQANQLVMAWHVRADGPVMIGDELAAYKAVPVAKLRPWPFATGDAVRDWLARRDQASR